MTTKTLKQTKRYESKELRAYIKGDYIVHKIIIKTPHAQKKQLNMNICSCYYDILLLNQNKIHKLRNIRRSSNRILSIIDKNPSKFSENIRELAMSAPSGIELNRAPDNHNCHETQIAVKNIKLLIKQNKVYKSKKGTQSNKALVPYYPGDDKSDVIFRRLQDGQLHCFIKKSDESNEYDSEVSSDSESDNQNENTERAKKLAAKSKSKMDTYIHPGKKLNHIIGHWYRCMEPRFKCKWEAPFPDSVLNAYQIMMFPKETKKYLLKLSPRSFNTLTHRTPKLWETVWDTVDDKEESVSSNIQQSA